MDWLDYREKLGIGFNDTQKASLFVTNIFSLLKELASINSFIIDNNEYANFCLTIGAPVEKRNNNLYPIMEVLKLHSKNFLDFISCYIALINSLSNKKDVAYSKDYFITSTENLLNRAHIPFEVLYDEKNNYFIFPKGAKELDDALVSEPLEWLNDYPNAHKTYCIALKQYSEGIYIRDVADNLRKALEAFLQEFLGNSQNLESNKNNICKYLGEQGVDAGVSSLYQTIINSYKNINDRIVKHNDNIDEKLLEFLLYQTGILIRMTITVKKAEDNTTTK